MAQPGQTAVQKRILKLLQDKSDTLQGPGGGDISIPVGSSLVGAGRRRPRRAKGGALVGAALVGAGQGYGKVRVAKPRDFPPPLGGGERKSMAPRVPRTRAPPRVMTQDIGTHKRLTAAHAPLATASDFPPPLGGAGAKGMRVKRKPSAYAMFVKKFAAKHRGQYRGPELLKAAAAEWHRTK